jgi:hypothetical protein
MAGLPEGSFYQRELRQGPPRANSLWGQYQKEKELLFQKRSLALNTLRLEHMHYNRQLKDWYQKRRASIKNNQMLSRKSKWALYKGLSQELKADFVQRKQQEAEQRQGIREQYPIPTWDQWLTQSASQGNLDALGILRGRERVRKRLAQALLTVKDFEAAKQIIYPQLKPFTRKNGDVVYRLKDGGVVEDSARAVHVPEITEAATLLALTLAYERFPGNPLIVEGTPDFKNKLAEIAGIKGLAVCFADPISVISL